MRDAGRKVVTVATDVADPEQCQALGNRLTEARPRIGARKDSDKSDADLDGRKESPRLVGKRQSTFGAGGTGLGHRLQSRLARRNDCQFAHRQQAVHRDQREDQDQVEPGKGKERLAHGSFRFHADNLASGQARRTSALRNNRH